MSNSRQPNAALIDPMVPLEDGHWVNERVAHIVEEIRAYHPRLDVLWNPTHKPDEPEFRIIEQTQDGQQHLVMTVKNQEEFTGEILTRIIQGDNSRHDVLSYIDAQNEAATRLQQKLVREMMEERLDVMQHVLKSPKHTYKVNEHLTIKDHGNR